MQVHAIKDAERPNPPSPGRGPLRSPHAEGGPRRDARAVRAELDETTLVVRAQEGDVHAFEELARRHQDALYRVAVRVLGNSSDAEDALQEAMIDAWRRIGSFRAEAAFSTWMYRIVTNRCTQQQRRTRRTVPVDEVDESLAVSGSGSPEYAAEMDAEMAALSRAVARLPGEQRTCWVLRELEGLGYAEISEITGAGENAVRGRIHRARTALAEVMRAWR